MRCKEGDLTMDLRPICVALSAVWLAACAGDNPNNVPLYGEWEMTTKLDSVSIDGMPIMAADLPNSFKQLESVEKVCGEPMFIDRDWQEDDINRRVNADCTIESFNHSPRRMTAAGVCTLVDPKADYSPKFDVSVAQAENKYRAVVTLDGSAKVQGLDGRHRVKAIAVQNGKRLGDC